MKKANHWVPQSYLRAFSIDPSQPKEKRKIWRFSKLEGEPDSKSIAKVAVKYHLYVPMNDDGTRDTSFEDKLSGSEQWFGSDLWKEIAHEWVDLCSETVRRLVSMQIAVTYLRNPQLFERHKNVHRQLVEFLGKDSELPSYLIENGKQIELDKGTWAAYRDATEDDLKRDWFKQIGSAAGIAEDFMKMRWSVLFTENPTFVTSDNPVTFMHPSLEFRGIRNRETSIIFPLSPTRVLLLDHKLTEPDGQYYPLSPGNEGPLNCLIWRGANEFMYSSRDPDLVCSEIVSSADGILKPSFWSRIKIWIQRLLPLNILNRRSRRS
jgi:hypothetical protein